MRLERHLRDVVTAVGVVFVRHRDNQNQRAGGHPIIPGPAMCTNAPLLPSPPLRSASLLLSGRDGKAAASNRTEKLSWCHLYLRTE